jgi:hypothetical protein
MSQAKPSLSELQAVHFVIYDQLTEAGEEEPVDHAHFMLMSGADEHAGKLRATGYRHVRIETRQIPRALLHVAHGGTVGR